VRPVFNDQVVADESFKCGIIIIAAVSYAISIFGYRIIHTYEKYSWMVTFVLLLVMFGQVAPYVDVHAPGFDTGLGLSGSYLSLIAIMFSNASGWCSIAADYYVNYPADTPFWTIFGLTWVRSPVPAYQKDWLTCMVGRGVHPCHFLDHFGGMLG